MQKDKSLGFHPEQNLEVVHELFPITLPHFVEHLILRCTIQLTLIPKRPHSSTLMPQNKLPHPLKTHIVLLQLPALNFSAV